MNQDDKDLSDQIKRHATRHAAPDHLRASLRTHIALASASRPAPAPSATSLPPAQADKARRLLRWWAARPGFGLRQGALGFALGAVFMLGVLPLSQDPPWGDPTPADLVASHVRALQVGPLAEVMSTDRHTVKPWFQGKLDFAPPVMDLAADGFPLLGGRIDRLRGKLAATLAYTRQRHVIDVYVWPAAARPAPGQASSRGFHVLQWSDGSMQYAAVSDIEPGELLVFAQRWRERIGAQ